MLPFSAYYELSYHSQHWFDNPGKRFSAYYELHDKEKLKKNYPTILLLE
ncbi:MAG: hypothetical protein GDA56_07015 [Hormoscilla sp. GM7CHS1pb]|nr:hypothetical protein [Hormoscilla sp. GM7CHS1pb]